ncbi:Hypothetical protein, putative [Bodo saltans]|uniref:Membrane-associated protein n=1 Tax=Bodo saltans TaxID=75058 RepID=A0A0S4JA87_BODSA|nr:Hypothetical protein, putative [Bodo saltans]|eukprot:CUG88374.1 Hypothetical protein, putative [Bodo saltans]
MSKCRFFIVFLLVAVVNLYQMSSSDIARVALPPSPPPQPSPPSATVVVRPDVSMLIEWERELQRLKREANGAADPPRPANISSNQKSHPHSKKVAQLLEEVDGTADLRTSGSEGAPSSVPNARRTPFPQIHLPPLEPHLPPPPPLVSPVKPRLILITPTNRPWYLSKGIHYVLPLLQCFDVRWLIIHTFKNKRAVFSPAFRDVFPWVTEIRAFDPHSDYGGHERNVGRDYVVTAFHGDALVYFLDDDNTLPDLCNMQPHFDPAKLNLQTLYFADQVHCGNPRLSAYGKNWTVWKNHTQVLRQVACLMDTGSFFIPLALIRLGRNVLWGFGGGSDAPFLASLVTIWMEAKGSTHVKRLRSFEFNYNQLSELSGCMQNPWKFPALNESLLEYRALAKNMTMFTAQQDKMTSNFPFKKVVLHEYGHILGPIRKALPNTPRTFLEIGVNGLGANLLFMSQHEYETNVIGVLDIADEKHHQLTAIQQLLPQFQGHGKVQLLEASGQQHSDTMARLNVTKVDILLFSVGESVDAVTTNFYKYKNLVADGGYMIFDEFTDYSGSNEVRRALMELTRDGKISLDEFHVIGTVGNRGFAGPFMGTEDDQDYDWPSVVSKMYIFRKTSSRAPPPPRRLARPKTRKS